MMSRVFSLFSALRQPLEPLNTVAWNPRVQHILATASVSHCTIWDLRRSDPVVHLTKAMCQLEPRLMRWSPDIATRLCLADPACPTADLQLWDLRYPKHMLALIGRWPPVQTEVDHVNLGNAGTINSLAWAPSSLSSSSTHGMGLHDTDYIAVSITSSGALATADPGNDLQLRSTEFLVVWSVNNGLQNVQTDTKLASGLTAPKPMFIGRLDDGGGENTSAIEPDGLPTNAAVHWLPRVPGLVSVNHSESWISVINLNAGADSPQSATATQHASLHVSSTGPRARHTSHRVAEAFGDEVDLSSSSPPPTLRDATPQVSSQCKLPIDSAHVGNRSPMVRSRSIEPSPQPLPYLRFAPRWMKRPCGARFGFGGRLVLFTTDNLSSDPARRQSVNGSNAPDSKESANRLVHIHHLDTIDPTSAHIADSSAEPEERPLPTLIAWLNTALTHGALDAWNEFGDEFSTVCRPRVLLSPIGRIDPWDFVRAGLHYSVDQLPGVFSQLLGYPNHVIQAEVEQALSQSLAQSSESSGFDRSGSDALALANSVLSAMKKALVGADLLATCRLAFHNALSVLPHPGFSPLASVAVILSTQLGMTELYSEVRKSVVDYVNRMTNHLDPRFEQLRAVALLFTALLLDDWSIVSSQWPLDDWHTCLTAVVNHAWAKDTKLFRDLCAALIARLLDTKSECSLNRSERCTAAWICAVCSGNLDGLVDAWHGLESVAVDDPNGKQLLPLALQLVLLTRSQLYPHDANPLTAAPVTHVFLTVASWLGQCGLVVDPAAVDCSAALVALRLLQPHCRLGQDAYAPACQEVAHRIWCGLSDEERRLANVDPRTLFACPYERSTNTQCPCGLNVPATSGHATQPIHHANRTVGPVQPYVTPQPALPGMMGMPPAMVPASPAASPVNLALASAFRGTSVPGTAAPSVHVSGPSPTFSPPTMPSSQTWTPPAVVPPSVPQFPPPPPPPPSHLGPTPPTTQMSTAQPSVMFQPTPTMVPGSTPPAPNWSMPQPPPPPPPPQSSHGRTSVSAATPGWNDPPMLSHTYKPLAQPVVSVNQFYDPAQYSSQRVSFPAVPVANTLASSLPSQPPSFPRPSAPAPGAATTTSMLHPSVSPPSVPPYNYPTQICQTPAAVAVPSVNSGSVQRPPSLPHYTDETAGAEIGALGLCPLPNRPANSPGAQWPAAIPLGTVAALNGASNHCQQPAVSAANGNVTMPSAVSGVGAVRNPETEFMVRTLTGLIQSCRTAGGKTCSVKMDTVERRLGPLFQSLQSNNLAGPVLDHLRVCVEAVSQSDFASALAHANRLIQSASGFESIHGFAPGLKILMQTARQLWPNGGDPHSGLTTGPTPKPWSIPAN